MAGEAEVRYLDGDFRVVRPGAFVRCAVTGLPIPLEELKYWSVDLQEAISIPRPFSNGIFRTRGGGCRTAGKSSAEMSILPAERHSAPGNGKPLHNK